MCGCSIIRPISRWVWKHRERKTRDCGWAGVVKRSSKVWSLVIRSGPRVAVVFQEGHMSTSAVSPLSTQQSLETYFQARHHDLRQLARALESGNLANAQQDYVTIQNLGQHGPFPSGNAFLNSTRQQDFENIGSALQSGDLASARQAFMQLWSTFHHADPQSAASRDPVISDPSQSGSISLKA